MFVLQVLSKHLQFVSSVFQAGEAPIHVAARYGHNTVIDYLCSVDADVNLQDKVRVCACESVCVRERQRECVCVCVCEREREKE